jgi:hypothetical protein
MLVGIAKVARDASLTGQLAGGKAVAIRNYNWILERVSSLELIEGSLFEPLPDSSSFDEVGLAATLLSDFLREEDEEGTHRRRWGHGGVFEASPGHVKIVGFPGNIGDLGELLREHLPDAIRERVGNVLREKMGKHHWHDGGQSRRPEPPPPPSPPQAPEPPPAGGANEDGGKAPRSAESWSYSWHTSEGSGPTVAAAAVDLGSGSPEHSRDPFSSGQDGDEAGGADEMAAIHRQIMEITGRIQRGEVRPDEMPRIGERLRELATRQAELGRS